MLAWMFSSYTKAKTLEDDSDHNHHPMVKSDSRDPGVNSIKLEIRCPACKNDTTVSTWTHHKCGKLMYINTHGNVFCSSGHSRKFIDWKWACKHHQSEFKNVMPGAKAADDFQLVINNLNEIMSEINRNRSSDNSNHALKADLFNQLTIVALITGAVAQQYRQLHVGRIMDSNTNSNTNTNTNTNR